MAKFLIIVPPFTGHVNPTLALGCELLKNGHKAAWISFDPSLGRKIPEGGEFFLLETNLNEVEKKKKEKELAELGKKSIYGFESLKFLYDDILIPMNNAMINGIEQITDKYRPDIIINDHQIFSAPIVAIRKNIPYVTSVTAPAAIKVNETFPKVYEWEGEQIINFQNNAGLKDNIRHDCSRLLTLVYTSQKFFGSSDLPGYYKFVGPVFTRQYITDSFDWDSFHKMNNPFKILVSIGTTFDHQQKRDFFDKVTDAFSNENVNVILVSDPQLFDNIPDNFMVCKQIPQVKLIPYMDAVVCHGGHNTVCESLSYAKPLVVLPIAYDQSYVSGRVTETGAGIRLNFNRFKPLQLREAVYAVINEKKYAENAQEIQISFENAGGVNEVMNLLQNIL